MTGMTDPSASTIKVRAVTDEETAFFFENGWVKVPGLISRDDAALLLDYSKSIFGEDGRKGLDPVPGVTSYYEKWFRSALMEGLDQSGYKPLSHSRDLGRNVARLLGRDSPIRLSAANSASVKLPNHGTRGGVTDWHQDVPGHPYFEGNHLTAWVALDEVTHDMGAMQFYSRSHRLGNLGRMAGPDWGGWGPRIRQATSLTPPVEMQPGDATFHMDATIHGTMANTSSRPRWAWTGNCIPGDARYTGAASPFTDGLGLELWGPLDHPNFPLIYKPES